MSKKSRYVLLTYQYSTINQIKDRKTIGKKKEKTKKKKKEGEDGEPERHH